MDTFNISEAKAQLSALIEKVVEKGEDVIISKAGKPVARLTRLQSARQPRKLGRFKGEITIPKDFDRWPEDLARSLGIIDER